MTPSAKALIGWVLAAESKGGQVARGALASFVAVASFSLVQWAVWVHQQIEEVTELSEEVKELNQAVEDIRAYQQARDLNREHRRRRELAELIRDGIEEKTQ